MLGCACVHKNSLYLITQLSNRQSIRWKKYTKPFWLGLAKSKMFVLPKVRPTPESEKLEKKRLRELYDTELKSILQFIKAENPLCQEDSAAASEQLAAHEELKKQIEESFLKNDIWNAKSAELREIRIKQAMEEYSSLSSAKIERHLNLQREMQIKVEKIIESETIKSKNFITPENLDEAVETCLNSMADYNFAIDLRGNKYVGQTPKEKVVQFENTSDTGGELELASRTSKPGT